MNTATTTKILLAVAQHKGPESIGFTRYFMLPNRIKKSIKLAHFLETGSTNAHKRIVEFFACMSETEYKNWLELA